MWDLGWRFALTSRQCTASPLAFLKAIYPTLNPKPFYFWGAACSRLFQSLALHKQVRWTPHPVIVTVRDNSGQGRV